MTNPMAPEARRAAALACAALGLLLAATAAAAGSSDLPPPLTPYEARYDVSRGALTLGESTTRLATDGDGRWVYETIARPQGFAKILVSGKATERSYVGSNGESLRALRYERRMPDDDAYSRVDFDWSERLAHIDHVDDGARVAPLRAGMQDPHAAILSVMIALARDDGEVSPFGVIEDDGDLSQVAFRVENGERVSVPYGDFDTVRVTRVREDKDRQLIGWFAPELDWMPVRIQQVKKGDTVARMDLRVLNDDEGAAGERAERNSRPQGR